MPSGHTLSDLDLQLQISHGRVGDLAVTLRHVDTDTTQLLIDRPGYPDLPLGCTGADANTVLDDEAGTKAESACPVPPPALGGHLSPSNALAIFDGQSLQGTWLLNVADLATGNRGRLLGWCLVPDASRVVIGLSTPTATVTAAATRTSTPTVTPTARAVTFEASHGFQGLRDLAATGGVAVRHEYRIRQQPYSSYEIVVDSTSGDIGPGLVLRRVGADGVTVLQESEGVSAMDFSRGLRWANEGSVVVADQVVRIQSGSCWTNCGPDDVYRLRAYDTTYSVMRFGNSATQVTVLLIENRTSRPVTGRAHFWSAAGTLLASHALSMPPMGSSTLNTSLVPGLAVQGGSVTITNDAGYGQLAGKGVALEPATGMSFDTPLIPRPR